MPIDPKILNDLGHRFNHHAPPTPEVAALYPTIRSACKDLAELIVRVVPASREQSLAFTKLEEVMFWANAGIARNPGKAQECIDQARTDSD